MNSNETEILAARIAEMLRETARGDSSDAVRLSLEQINRRLDLIESNQAIIIGAPADAAVHDAQHPSQQRLVNLEELADEIFNGLTAEKICPYEPAGKPCDNCSMCNSRGF